MSVQIEKAVAGIAHPDRRRGELDTEELCAVGQDIIDRAEGAAGKCRLWEVVILIGFKFLLFGCYVVHAIKVQTFQFTRWYY